MPHVPPPLVGLAAGVIQHHLGSGTRPGLVRRSAAFGAAAASTWFLAGSARRFRSVGTTVNPLEPERATGLVTTGPNAVTRNPMYVGMAGLLVTHGVLRGGWCTVLPVAGFVVVIDRVQIRPEEAVLHELFEEQYAAYCRRVRRWL